MDFKVKSKKRDIKPIKIQNEDLYPHNVQLYRLPPTKDISLEEFETLALNRLKVLRIIEQENSKGKRIYSDEWKQGIKEELIREGLKGYERLFKGGSSTAEKKDLDVKARRADYLSHFILRLCYCRSVELIRFVHFWLLSFLLLKFCFDSRWFVAREMELFRYKFSCLSGTEIKEFLAYNKLDYSPLTEDEKNEVKNGLFESTMGPAAQTVATTDFYKVYFTSVPDLVRSRKCFIKNGYAYVSSTDFVSIVGATQQKLIENGLVAATKLLQGIQNDERISSVLSSLHTSYTGKDYTFAKNSDVPIESLDTLSTKSFPICMKTVHEDLRAKHHLKHASRMQYGLFLKGIGVTLEGSLKFWREEFTKLIDHDKFDKQYSYNIRHNYGKEGSMNNYTPYSCLKIITGNVGIGDNHGCPFKNYDKGNLKTKFSSYGISPAHSHEILSFVEKGHFQLACGKYFQVSHDVKVEQGINHPNQYFELSQHVMGNRASKEAAKPDLDSSRFTIQTNKGVKTIVSNEKNNMNNDMLDEMWAGVEEASQTLAALENVDMTEEF